VDLIWKVYGLVKIWQDLGERGSENHEKNHLLIKRGRTQINQIAPAITWQIITGDSNDTMKKNTWDPACEISEYSKA
jgi:hypothetical protein